MDVKEIRSETVMSAVTITEKIQIEAAAKDARRSVSDFIRITVLDSIKE